MSPAASWRDQAVRPRADRTAALLRYLLGERCRYARLGEGPLALQTWLRVRISFGARALRDWVRAEHIDLPPLRGLIVSAEILYPHQRALLMEIFRAPIFNFYGSREVPNIAATCAQQRMHQVADWVFTEFVSDSTLPASRLIVTPLESRAMPLIRYANDDLGTPADGDCPCGLPYPLMDLNVARVVDVFVTPEGRHVYGQFFTHFLYGIAGIKQFQFHQIAADTIRLLIQRTPRSMRPRQQSSQKSPR